MKIQEFKTGTKVKLKFAFSNRITTGIVRAKSYSSRLLLVCFDDNRLEWLPFHLFEIRPEPTPTKVNCDPTGKTY